jgi:hypothetical protein
VPDPTLQGTIISYGDWDGILIYESGSRLGNTVVVTTTIYPRYTPVAWAPNGKLTLFGCLGQSPLYDHMGTVVPTSTLRVYDDTGREVTQDIVILATTVMGTEQPLAGSTQGDRYPVVEYGLNRPNPLPLDAEGLHIPPNSGCSINLPGDDYYPLTGVFSLTVEPSVQATVLGTQQANFQSYIGPGWVGIFEPLMSQLQQRYGNRHDWIPLSIPAGANYFLLKFPPMSGDAYTGCCTPPYLNADRPTGGTYRLTDGLTSLCADLVFSAGFPLAQAWQDTDQAPGTTFLPVLSTLTHLAPPEYVLPADMPYDSCFTEGNCPDGVLQQIYDAVMSLEVVYLRVNKPAAGGQWVPLRMAGPAWSPASLGGPAVALEPPDLAAGIRLRASTVETETHSFFLPLVTTLTSEEPPSGCPCGWLDDLGRMLSFWPGP